MTRLSFAALLSALLAMLSVASAIKFNLEALPDGNTRCIREFVGKETLVVVKVQPSSGTVGDGQQLSLLATDIHGNRLAYKDNVWDKTFQTFSASPDTSFDVCITNKLTGGRTGAPRSRDIDLTIEVGASARDYNAMQASERLKPAEIDLRRLNDLADEIKEGLEFLRSREEKLRNTNESTNHRTKVFFTVIMVSFLALGAWQIQYLRAYFRSKHII